MASGWHGRSVATNSLTRLPQGICCGICGLTEPTDGDGPFGAQWALMAQHVMEQHCTACCVCRKPATGLIELRTGGLAPWLELDRARRGAVASPEPTAAALGLDAAAAVTLSAKRPGDALDGAPEPKKAQAAAD
ncbi:hypothetical protein SO694_000980102 [Aureococcus anophagefferens]|uniref:LIM zinc-binding domain-containing protein n=1 Tax=Aureococcus anophagefferens TaxID=44056 RepID=A0ABR1FSS7_AURAN